MIGIIIVSENKVAAERLKTLKRLLGDLQGIKAIELAHSISPADMLVKLQKGIKAVDQGDGVIVVTDLFGSTQCQVCTKVLDQKGVHLISGYNLPLLIKVASNQHKSMTELLAGLEDYGRLHLKEIVQKI